MSSGDLGGSGSGSWLPVLGLGAPPPGVPRVVRLRCAGNGAGRSAALSTTPHRDEVALPNLGWDSPAILQRDAWLGLRPLANLLGTGLMPVSRAGLRDE